MTLQMHVRRTRDRHSARGVGLWSYVQRNVDDNKEWIVNSLSVSRISDPTTGKVMQIRSVEPLNVAECDIIISTNDLRN